MDELTKRLGVGAAQEQAPVSRWLKPRSEARTPAGGPQYRTTHSVGDRYGMVGGGRVAELSLVRLIERPHSGRRRLLLQPADDLFVGGTASPFSPGSASLDDQYDKTDQWKTGNE